VAEETQEIGRHLTMEGSAAVLKLAQHWPHEPYIVGPGSIYRSL